MYLKSIFTLFITFVLSWHYFDVLLTTQNKQHFVVACHWNYNRDKCKALLLGKKNQMDNYRKRDTSRQVVFVKGIYGTKTIH